MLYTMERMPEMTKEFKRLQKEQYELFLHKQHDDVPTYQLVLCYKHQRKLSYH